jgi:hypothetical protein
MSPEMHSLMVAPKGPPLIGNAARTQKQIQRKNEIFFLLKVFAKRMGNVGMDKN